MFAGGNRLINCLTLFGGCDFGRFAKLLDTLISKNPISPLIRPGSGELQEKPPTQRSRGLVSDRPIVYSDHWSPDSGDRNLSRSRQIQHNSGTDSQGGLYRNLSVMTLHDGMTYGKPKPHPSLTVGILGRKIGIEDLRKIRFGDT